MKLVPILYKQHQNIGIFICLAIIAWGLSGLAHPIITRLNPKPAKFMPPMSVINLSTLLPAKQVLLENGIESFKQLRLFNWNNEPYYRVETDNQTLFIHGINNTIKDNAEKDYANFLARYYLGDSQSSIKSTVLQTGFDNDYVYVNRLLPVYKVSFDREDNTTVYVETSTGRLGTIVDNHKSITGQIFRYMHSWVFVENTLLRSFFMSVFLGLGFCIALAGTIIYWSTRKVVVNPNAPKAKIWHRRIAGIISVVALTFSFSGTFHLWTKYINSEAPLRQVVKLPSESINSNALNNWQNVVVQAEGKGTSLGNMQLTNVSDQLYWLMQYNGKRPHKAPAHHDHSAKPKKPEVVANDYININSGQILEDGSRQHAIALASTFSQYPVDKINNIQLVTKFAGEYGFVNKRLPVYAINYKLEGNPTIYVETRSNTLAAVVDNADRVEGYSFSYIHKWHFLDFLGKGARDTIVAIAALLLVTLVSLGIYQYIGKRRSKSMLEPAIPEDKIQEA